MDMQDQPRYEVYEPSGFFKDGQASRPPVEGTVPRGAQFRDPDAYQYSGKNAGAQASASGTRTATDAASVQRQGAAAAAQGGGASNAGTNLSTGGGGAQPSGDVNVRGNVGGGVPAGGNNQAGAQQQSAQGGPDVFPFPIDAAALERGQERFNIYCSMCHGATGDGDGMIVRRGFRRPPSFHEERLQTGEAAAAHYFDVITNGWGAMPDYAAQIPWEDRWRIIAYVRALQLSRRATVADLPPDAQERIRKTTQGTTTGGHQEQQQGGTHR
ncbi:MAG TPA: cytochrome c [Pyrinomonadaceae bacterium]|nr:cytochrome c [Pyrinomonadaceae bacterium]